MKKLASVTILLLILGCTPMASKAKRYSGDGKLRACSNLLAQGCAITFPPFPSDQPYEASYKLSHVPATGHDPLLHLRFGLDPGTDSDKSKKSTTATIHVVLEDSSGKEVKSMDLPLAKATWGEWSGKIAAYDSDMSVFHFDPGARYILRVNYIPGTTPPPAKELYFEIDGCAYY